MFEGDSETIVGDAANGRSGVQPIETKDVQQEETTRREHQEEAARPTLRLPRCTKKPKPTDADSKEDLKRYY